MPEGPDGKTIIIVKKVSGHGGHHGGAWKVAYADFVTAMMALFMVLWLVNSASVTTREKIARYFREPGIFEAGSGTPLELGGAGILDSAFAPPADGNSKTAFTEKIYTTNADIEHRPDLLGAKGGRGADGERSQFERLAEELRKAIEEGAKKSKLAGKVDVTLDSRGLHIEIMDTNESSMFESGHSRMSRPAEEQLSVIADILRALPNPVDIEGHTDAVPFSGSEEDYDNWDLSTDRANEARRVLERAGIAERRIARVVGYAAQQLKLASDPYHPSNRRISISMRFLEGPKVAVQGAKNLATTTESQAGSETTHPTVVQPNPMRSGK